MVSLVPHVEPAHAPHAGQLALKLVLVLPGVERVVVLLDGEDVPLAVLALADVVEDGDVVSLLPMSVRRPFLGSACW